MSLAWDAAREWIARSLAEAHGAIACGAGTDQLSEIATLDQIIAAYKEQCEWIESRGGRGDPDGQPRTGSLGPIPRRLFRRLFANPFAIAGTALAWSTFDPHSQDIGAQTIWIGPRKPALR